MKSVLSKTIVGILTVVAAVALYGVISWHVFGKPTFLSGNGNCMPRIESGLSIDAESLTKDLFGRHCRTY